MIIRNLAIFVASGAYSGFVPKSPGTFGSLVCLALWLLISQFAIMHTTSAQLLLIAFVCVAGLISSRIYLNSVTIIKNDGYQHDDPQFIVIDEWAGLLISLIGLSSADPFSFCAAFVLFRIFDIFKPGPVGWAESLPGEYGIMFDDIIAGILSFLCLQITGAFF